jgi:hypothetical protein
MDALPNIYVTWTESAEPLTSFLRYQVYRRRAASPPEEPIVLATISDRAVTSYQDFHASSGVRWQYNVTVVGLDTAGEEIESAFGEWVEVELAIRSFFLHVVGKPERYVEVLGNTAELEPQQEVELVELWSRPAPSAHTGERDGRVVRITTEAYWPEEREVWEALLAVRREQIANGAVLCLRGYRDEVMFGALVSLPRADSPEVFTYEIEFHETGDYVEGVS